MTVPTFKRVFRMGAKGSDVLAVKRTLRQLGYPKVSRTRMFGRAACSALKHFQHDHGLQADGVYGKQTHEKLATHFDRYSRWLYNRERPPVTDVTKLSRRQAALMLMHYYAEGRFHDDSGRDHEQIAATSEGLPVTNAIGQKVYLDPKMLQSLCFLIQKGYKIGTFALCSDHSYESALGHGGGHAVDISSINGVSVVASGTAAEQLTLQVMRVLHSGMPPGLTPWQLICDGSGGVHVQEISDLTIPGLWYYGPVTMSEHRNHIHNGY